MKYLRSIGISSQDLGFILFLGGPIAAITFFLFVEGGMEVALYTIFALTLVFGWAFTCYYLMKQDD